MSSPEAEGSPLRIGARGLYRGAAFSVVGHARLKTPLGFWHDWLLTFEDGRAGRLGETDGAYAVSFKTTHAAPPRDGLKPLGTVELGGRPYRVLEIRAATTELLGENGSFGLLDYSQEPPAVFLGEYQDFDALAFTGL